MLADLLSTPSSATYHGGIPQDVALAPFRRRLAEAERYTLDAEAVAMAASVSLSKPSTVRAALSWVRLPHPTTWIEFSNSALRQAMAMLGSPNVEPEGTSTRIMKSGFLLTEDGPGRIRAEYAHLDEAGGMQAADLAPVLLSFDHGEEAPDTSGAITGRDPDAVPSAGRMRAYQSAVSTDPGERRAADELASRMRPHAHPDMLAVSNAFGAEAGMPALSRALDLQAREACRLFTMQVLPALILLNCRNAIEAVPADLSKLNKARARKGKPALLAHRVIRIHLTKARILRAESCKGGRGYVRGTLVIGHFKVRSSGVFWWSHHARGDSRDAIGRKRLVTA